MSALSRAELERAEGWRAIIDKVPFIALPRGWKIAVIPPFGGAVARFRVRSPAGIEKSVYLDAHQALGHWSTKGEAYWEVHPVDGDCGRCAIGDAAGLLKLLRAKP